MAYKIIFGMGLPLELHDPHCPRSIWAYLTKLQPNRNEIPRIAPALFRIRIKLTFWQARGLYPVYNSNIYIHSPVGGPTTDTRKSQNVVSAEQHAVFGV